MAICPLHLWARRGAAPAHRQAPPFDDSALREELRAKLNAIPGVELPLIAEAKRPSIDLAVLSPTDSLRMFTDTMDWAFAQANGSSTSSSQQNSPADLPLDA